MSDKPVIRCMANGPLILKGEVRVEDSSGKAVDYERQIALCRCGESANKPFCDGAHSKIGFTGDKTSDGSKNQKQDFAGGSVTVRYNKELCSHAAMCVGNLPEVFKPGSSPWIEPDGADADKLKATVRKCPSGALSYVEGSNETIDFGLAQAKVVVAKDGPYYVEGGVEVADTEFAEGSSREHYALCRCGKSRNKPFCDGYHHDVDFKAD